MEWTSGKSDYKFFQAYTELPTVENSVIDYDIQNVRKILSKKLPSSGETMAKRVNNHYKDSTKFMKRSYGVKPQEDFQNYTWGLVLTSDLGLNVDKLEILAQVYCCKAYPRISKNEYCNILSMHSSIRKIKSNEKRSTKWRDVHISWHIHANKKHSEFFTISKRDFMRIIEVNSIDFDIDLEKLTRAMKASDEKANNLYALLIHDPLIQTSNVSPKRTEELDLRPATHVLEEKKVITVAPVTVLLTNDNYPVDRVAEEALRRDFAAYDEVIAARTRKKSK